MGDKLIISGDKMKADVARSAARQFSDSIVRHGKKSKGFSDLLSRLYAQVDKVLEAAESVQDEDLVDPVRLAKQADVLKSLAKVLPALQQAEKSARTRIKEKAVEELTDAELAKLAGQVLGGDDVSEP